MSGMSWARLSIPTREEPPPPPFPGIYNHYAQRYAQYRYSRAILTSIPGAIQTLLPRDRLCATVRLCCRRWDCCSRACGDALDAEDGSGDGYPGVVCRCDEADRGCWVVCRVSEVLYEAVMYEYLSLP